MKPTAIWYDTKTGQKTVSYKKKPGMPEGMTDKKPLLNSKWVDGQWKVKKKFKLPSLKKLFI